MQRLKKGYDIGVRLLGNQHALIKRVLIVFVLVDWIWRYYSHLCLHQLAPAPLTRVLYAPTYHLYKMSGVESILMGTKYGSFLFDIAFSMTLIALFWKPLNRTIGVLFFILLSMYAIVYPVHIAFSVHYFAPIWIMSTVFLVRGASTFEYWWEALRYYACWIYGSAFVWKLIYGAMYDWDNGWQVYKANMGQYLLLNPDHWMYDFYIWVYNHSYLLNAGQYIAFALEAFFIVGFFTKRYDGWLLWCIPILHISLYLFVDTLFVESFILCLLFISKKKWITLYHRFYKMKMSN